MKKQPPEAKTNKAEVSKSIQKAITETFARSEPTGFMTFISDLMESYGLKKLAMETGIDRVTLWRFMRGERLPRLDTLQKILTALGIKVHFTFEKRMENFVEYTYWRKQKETGNHEMSKSQSEVAS